MTMGIENIIGIIQQAKVACATEAVPDHAGKPYRPGSGTEGMAFDDAWCAYCARDAAFRTNEYVDPELGCKILADTFVYEITDPEYPKEWIYGGDGRPRCTAFTEDPTCPVRCDKTIDMFP